MAMPTVLEEAIKSRYEPFESIRYEADAAARSGFIERHVFMADHERALQLNAG